MTRRNFTAEFKSEAAKLVLDDGYSQTKACAAKGIGPSAIRS